MKQQSETIRHERETIEAAIAYEDADGDPQGYAFTEGYLLGLRRAQALLAGDTPWEWEDLCAWYLLHIAGGREGR